MAGRVALAGKDVAEDTPAGRTVVRGEPEERRVRVGVMLCGVASPPVGMRRRVVRRALGEKLGGGATGRSAGTDDADCPEASAAASCGAEAPKAGAALLRERAPAGRMAGGTAESESAARRGPPVARDDQVGAGWAVEPALPDAADVRGRRSAEGTKLGGLICCSAPPVSCAMQFLHVP